MHAARRIGGLLMVFVLVIGTVATAARAGNVVHSLIPSVSATMPDDCPDDASGGPSLAFCAKVLCVTLLGFLPPDAMPILDDLPFVSSDHDQAGEGLSLAPEPGPPRTAALFRTA